MAFYARNNDTKELVVYGVGEPVFKLTVGKQLCLNDKCTQKADFIASYMSQRLPENILDEILEARPIVIADSQIVKTSDGFEQYAQSDDYDIVYVVNKNGITFIEKRNKIIIKIKENEE